MNETLLNAFAIFMIFLSGILFDIATVYAILLIVIGTLVNMFSISLARKNAVEQHKKAHQEQEN